MSILLVDSELATKLDQADGSMQVCTRDGRLLQPRQTEDHPLRTVDFQ